MPHLVLGILIMLGGAAIMAAGLYVRSVGTPGGTDADGARGVRVEQAVGRSTANLVATVLLLLVGLAIVIVGIVVSFEPAATAPR